MTHRQIDAYELATSWVRDGRQLTTAQRDAAERDRRERHPDAPAIPTPAHPLDDLGATWTPDTICRLCEPRANSRTTTYCHRCANHPMPAHGACPGCRQPLLLPGRELCARCRLDREPTAVEPDPPRPDLRSTCEGCNAHTAVADGHCLRCRLHGAGHG